MEVDLLGGQPMQSPLGGCQPAEHSLGTRPGASGQTGGLVDNRPDSSPCTFRPVRGRVDIDSQLGRRQACPGRFGNLDVPTGDREPFQAGDDFVEISTSVDEAPKSHVAGDPGKAVPPCDRRQWATRASF